MLWSSWKVGPGLPPRGAFPLPPSHLCRRVRADPGAPRGALTNSD
jgi:hypothetical protein